MKKENKIFSIYFKNVGQGDSILFEWFNNEGLLEIGIIDCVKKSNKSPVEDHLLLKKDKIKKIKFVILSHPHTDHFSGMESLLLFCKKYRIIIDEFYHTAELDPDYIKKMMTKNPLLDEERILYNPVFGSKKERLRRLYSLLDSYDRDKNNGVVKRVRCISIDNYRIQLNDVFSLIFYSPIFGNEIRNYIDSISDLDDAERILLTPNNSTANLLSTVLLLYSENFQMFFSSDSTKNTHLRLLEDTEIDFSKANVCQPAHHGSEKNFVEDFWKKKFNIKNLDVIISAGEQYGHPDSNVIKFFSKSKSVHCTNNVNGFKQHFNKSDEIANNINELLFDLDIEINNPKIECGEKKISIFENGNYTIETSP